MSISRISACMLTMLVMIGFVHRACAQHEHLHPFDFQTDLQFFAPVEFDEFGVYLPGKTGWYFSYDRAYISVTRPDTLRQGSQPWDGDFTWGNRFDLGFMRENGGWGATYWHIDGPTETDVRRVNYVIYDPADDEHDPDSDDYDPNFQTFVFDDNINAGDLSSIEINRYFRLPQYANGAVLEPYIGVRYVKFLDFPKGGSVESILPITPTVTNPNRQIERVFGGDWTNNILGGQVGFRWNLRRGRWNVSVDGKALAAQNFQYFSVQRTTNTVVFDDGLGDTTPPRSTIEIEKQVADPTEFTYATEVRVEAAFDLSRDFAINFGLEALQFFQGIGRGADVRRNDGDLGAFGVTFGLVVNR